MNIKLKKKYLTRVGPDGSWFLNARWGNDIKLVANLEWPREHQERLKVDPSACSVTVPY